MNFDAIQKSHPISGWSGFGEIRPSKLDPGGAEGILLPKVVLAPPPNLLPRELGRRSP
jgi:hypothetical protein